MLSGILLIPVCILAATWVETTQQDFSDGTHESNLYASYRDGGTVEFAPRFDLDDDGYIDMVCADMGGPHATVYFGDSSGFSVSRSRLLPSGSGGECDMADLDCDGDVELIHAAWHTDVGVIYWGSNSGPSPIDTTGLPTNTAEAITTSDLDRDGYLDLVFAGECPANVTIYWGSATGYSVSRALEIPIGSALGHQSVVADLDKDGHLDLAVCCIADNTRQPIIYFGPNRSYRIEWLDYLGAMTWGPHGITFADLDNNDWLDVVYTGFNVVSESYIYFGSENGFSTTRRTIIRPEKSCGGSAAYDFNEDGWLDLIFFRGNGALGGPWRKPIIYLNTGASPYFADSHTQEAGPLVLNATGGTVADFNRDGYVDIFVDNLSTHSVALWGPSWNSCDTLPCNDAHHGVHREPGNVYDRTYREEYVSSVFDAESATTWQTISWDDTTPSSSSIEMAIRTGDTAEPDSSWSGWLALGNGDSIPDTLASRYIQYRAAFRYETPAVLPMLFEVRVDYGPGANRDVGVIRIVSPTGIVDSGTVHIPQALVRNHGTVNAVFPVTMRIGSTYTETVQETLPAGISDTVSFPVWTASPVGTHPVICHTSLAGDENPANDTATTTVTINPQPLHDVGTVEIFEPEPLVPAGDTVRPRAFIRNFGTVTERYFDVRFRIGQLYSEVITVPSVAANSAVELSFPPWVAFPGSFTVSCSTMLANDTNPTNDKLAITIAVMKPLLLYIERDKSDTMHVGETRSFEFYAQLEGDTGAVVEIPRVDAPVRWSTQLYDANNADLLPDTDNDGLPDLGFVSPGPKHYFNLRVEAPKSLAGDTSSLLPDAFIFLIRGFAGNDSLVKDSAWLTLGLAPNLEIHNFPNPLENRTTFVIGLPDKGKASLTIYNRVGERIRQLLENEPRSAKVHLVKWTATNDFGQLVAPGTYQYVLEYTHQGKTDRIAKKLVVTRK